VSRARGARRLALLAALRLAVLPLALTACTTQPPPYEQRVHVVRAGDTLYKIAWQYRLDQRDLARWNGLRDPDVIHVGQRLRLTPPPRTASSKAPVAASAGGGAPTTNKAPPRSNPASGTAPSSSAPRSAPAPSAEPPLPNLPPPLWTWPAEGAVVTRFGSHDGIATGVGIGGREGEPVHAAAGGRVVYAGAGLVGYGQLVIIKHNETYLTAYGYNSKLVVSQGQEVARGQTIAAMGLGPERQARLHFEIRRNGVPVDPLQFFPQKR
jgi:lipoprotein NlpD